MENEIEKINYKGYSIKLYQDTDYQGDPNDYKDDDLFLVHFHRDFEVKRNDIITEDDVRNIYQGRKIEQLKKYHIFFVDAYIHSGITLSLAGGFSGRLPQGHEQFDVSKVGLVLVSKKETKTKKQAEKLAQGLIDEWNYNLEGSIFGYIAESKEEEDVGSCWGFIGDYQEIKEQILEEAKAEIEADIKEKKIKHEKKLKAQIKNRVALKNREAINYVG